MQALSAAAFVARNATRRGAELGNGGVSGYNLLLVARRVRAWGCAACRTRIVFQLTELHIKHSPMRYPDSDGLTPPTE
uniref:Uncharacterized protein n=1 Tax=Conchiformibius kuhniae TaxID=211502 RepID=A0A8T9MUV5_9NEIS|nr:hypothetical protein LVJ77_01215 [Conchiformibius kuhniae]